MDKPTWELPETNSDEKPESDTRPTNGDYSYSDYSSFQRECANTETLKMEEEIMANFDVKKLSSSSSTVRIADMGCAVGPNTFISMQNLVQFITNKHNSQCPNAPVPEFQVFFNDQTSNDFNALFRSLPPNPSYFPVGVPGSFYGRLFPASSLHFVHSSYSLHWLSGLPEEVKNKGRIHYTNSPRQVFEAYSAQFVRDMNSFLSARAEEIVGGGLLTIITSGIPSDVSFSQLPTGIMYDCMSTTLVDMSKEGLVEEGKVDSFNFPLYVTTIEEMEETVEKEGSFSIERMEASDPASWLEGDLDVVAWIGHLRAAMEATFSKHLGAEVTHEMFQRLHTKKPYLQDQVHGKIHGKNQLFIVLKRKDY